MSDDTPTKSPETPTKAPEAPTKAPEAPTKALSKLERLWAFIKRYRYQWGFWTANLIVAMGLILAAKRGFPFEHTRSDLTVHTRFSPVAELRGSPGSCAPADAGAQISAQSIETPTPVEGPAKSPASGPADEVVPDDDQSKKYDVAGVPDAGAAPEPEDQKAAPGTPSPEVGTQGEAVADRQAASGSGAPPNDLELEKETSIADGASPSKESGDDRSSPNEKVRSKKGYVVHAMVLLAGVPIEDAHVLVTARGHRGTQYFVDSRQTDKSGIACDLMVPATLGDGDDLAALDVVARIPLEADPQSNGETSAALQRILRLARANDPNCWTEDGKPTCGQDLVLRGASQLSVSDAGTYSQLAIRAEAGVLGFLLLLFVNGIAIAFLGRVRLGAAAGAMSISALGVFAVLLFVVIASGYARVLDGAFNSDLLEIGIGYIQRGTFVPGGDTDWVYSLTLPSPRTGLAEGDRKLPYISGFGAPLWVIVLAVAGSGILAVQLILKVIASSSGAKASDGVQLDGQVVGALQRQVVVAFSPIGAIFVYQGLIGIGVSSVVPIATAALAAGLAVDSIMDQAWKAVHELFKDEDSDEDRPGPGSPSKPAADNGAQGKAKEERPEVDKGADNGGEPKTNKPPGAEPDPA